MMPHDMARRLGAARLAVLVFLAPQEQFVPCAALKRVSPATSPTAWPCRRSVLELRPRRALLYVPGDSERKIQKVC